MLLLRSLFVAGLLFITIRTAAASQVMAMDLAALTSDADSVVVGEILSVKSAWTKGKERILTTIELKVAEVWKGTVPGDGRMTIVQPGGVADGIEMRVHGLPSFAAGERAVLFLRGTKVAARSVVGMGQGKRGLHYETSLKRWMADGGDRSAAIRMTPQGASEPAPAEPALPLEELRRRVQGLMKR